jgi:hypothetical protein
VWQWSVTERKWAERMRKTMKQSVVNATHHAVCFICDASSSSDCIVSNDWLTGSNVIWRKLDVTEDPGVFLEGLKRHTNALIVRNLVISVRTKLCTALLLTATFNTELQNNGIFNKLVFKPHVRPLTVNPIYLLTFLVWICLTYRRVIGYPKCTGSDQFMKRLLRNAAIKHRRLLP